MKGRFFFLVKQKNTDSSLSGLFQPNIAFYWKGDGGHWMGPNIQVCFSFQTRSLCCFFNQDHRMTLTVSLSLSQ